ncbi:MULTISPECIES: CBS domain-containing protein [unclassified Halobacterium]|uniref:CBS domain-containing protein n=1 Tax=unclassified Halobacterium TaxID=2668073 RepID=UPI0019665FE5|nr:MULTISPECIES: CBS domain-containing protein [unclassified Halobacterium]QRY22516.1 CBS domain-containing protein [Halobacterium sp. GSL-19]QRY24581.1 CBS domain-containing protein [Halobacterium sp. BOL4-2]
MNVADAMTPRDDVVTVELPGTRDDILEYLQERAFSAVPVVKASEDGERYRGLISRDDLIERPEEDQLALLMRDVPTTTQDTTVPEVASLMVDSGTRRVPVVEDERLEGIVTVTDVVRAIADGQADGDTDVGGLARRDINTTYEGAPLTVAERSISYANVPYSVVLGETGDMAGMVTEVDIIDVARVVEGEDKTGDSMAADDDDWKWESIKAVGSRYLPTRNVQIPAEPVREFMTSDVVTVTGKRTSRDAAQTMLDTDIEQLPLMSGDELTGIVRDVDLLAALTDE